LSYNPRGYVEGIPHVQEEHKNGAVRDVVKVAGLCNDAKIVGTTSDNTDIFERVGEPTEAALCVLTEKLCGPALNESAEVMASSHVTSLRQSHPRRATLEFTRDRKSMSVLCDETTNYGKTSNNSNTLYVKGAPNLLLNRCTHYKTRSGKVLKLNGPVRREIEERIQTLATRPLRCLALAVKETNTLEKSLKTFRDTEDDDEEEDISSSKDKNQKGKVSSNSDGTTLRNHPLLSDPSQYKNIESGLTLVGVVGIKDPARPEVAQSIIACRDAGIRVIMITGDAKDTAIAIAKDVNIFTQEDRNMPLLAFEGRDFFDKTIEEQLSLLSLQQNMVFCRAEPTDKQILIQLLQSQSEITAMTGDGVNDAPALQQAEIGIAMGITGTEVAKEASDIILAKDDFSTIVTAVEEGRRIYANMQSFICFLISCNIGEIFTILLSTLLGVPEPLTAMHLLWVNLVTDGPPATALGFNPPSPDLMLQKPRPKDEPIMTKWLLTRYCVTGFYVGLATVGIFVGHYLGEMKLTWGQLRNWSKCGDVWNPTSQASSCDDLFGKGRMLPQTLSLTTLVCMEMLKALSAVSVDASMLVVPPHRNPWLLLGVAVPFALHLVVLYSEFLGIPAFGESFGLVPLSLAHWKSVFLWSVPILLVDEVLKSIGRYLNGKKLQQQQQD